MITYLSSPWSDLSLTSPMSLVRLILILQGELEQHYLVIWWQSVVIAGDDGIGVKRRPLPVSAPSLTHLLSLLHIPALETIDVTCRILE